MCNARNRLRISDRRIGSTMKWWAASLRMFGMASDCDNSWSSCHRVGATTPWACQDWANTRRLTAFLATNGSANPIFSPVISRARARDFPLAAAYRRCGSSLASSVGTGAGSRSGILDRGACDTGRFRSKDCSVVFEGARVSLASDDDSPPLLSHSRLTSLHVGA